MGYLLDTNALLDAYNRFYQFSFMPGFWDWIEQELQKGQFLSIDRVFKEIKSSEEDRNSILFEWVDRNRGCFVELDVESTRCLGQLMSCLTNKLLDGKKQYSSEAINQFADCADPYLIAYAKVHDHILVTNEKPAPRSHKSVKIPDACALVGVGVISLFDLLTSVRPQFVLGQPAHSGL